MSRLRTLFARSADPYAGGDIATARRLGALVWLVCTGAVVVLLPLAPPDKALGAAGWPLIGAGVAAGLVWAVRLARSARAVTWNELLRASYLAIAQIALLQWLAGDAGATAYGEVYLVFAVFARTTLPPRRVFAVLAALAPAACLPLFYAERSSELVAQTATRLVL